MPYPGHVLVAVPARDEEARLPAALAAVAVAAEVAERAGVRVSVVVSADACADRTAEVARMTGAAVVEVRHGRAGAARHAAVLHGLAAVPDPSAVWIASTDADSLVDADWLLVHLAAARAGTALLLGSVRPNPAELAPHHRAAWAARYRARMHHDHVHGANLGVRADAYLAAGGFPDLATGEDVALVAAVRALGLSVDSTDAAPVVTSARIHARAPGGFAAYLRREILGAAEAVQPGS